MGVSVAMFSQLHFLGGAEWEIDIDHGVPLDLITRIMKPSVLGFEYPPRLSGIDPEYKYNVDSLATPRRFTVAIVRFDSRVTAHDAFDEILLEAKRISRVVIPLSIRQLLSFVLSGKLSGFHLTADISVMSSKDIIRNGERHFPVLRDNKALLRHLGLTMRGHSYMEKGSCFLVRLN